MPVFNLNGKWHSPVCLNHIWCSVSCLVCPCQDKVAENWPSYSSSSSSSSGMTMFIRQSTSVGGPDPVTWVMLSPGIWIWTGVWFCCQQTTNKAQHLLCKGHGSNHKAGETYSFRVNGEWESMWLREWVVYCCIGISGHLHGKSMLFK